VPPLWKQQLKASRVLEFYCDLFFKALPVNCILGTLCPSAHVSLSQNNRLHPRYGRHGTVLISEVGTSESLKMTAVWNVAPCSLVEVYPTCQWCVLPPSSGRWLITFMMGPASTSKTSVNFSQITQRSNPGGIFVLAAVRLWAVTSWEHCVASVICCVPAESLGEEGWTS
jgi:hypothetical protein